MNATGRMGSLAVAAAALAGLLGTAAAEEIELGPRYIDPAHGFSLCPPLDTERKRETSLSRMVGWSRRDSKSGAILWTLTVLQGKESKPIADLAAYSRALAQKLREDEELQVESAEVGQVAGKPALDLRGVTGGKVRFWKRQVWVLAEPDRFVIFVVSGPVDLKDRMAAILQAVLGTVEIIDPKVAQERRDRNLQRGEKFLAGLTKEKLRKALRPQPQWYLLRQKGQAVGFLCVAESPVVREKAEGVEVRTWLLLAPPNGPATVLRREMFATADRAQERWAESLTEGEAPGGPQRSQEGIKQNEVVVCTVTQVGRPPETRNRPVPVAVYLPQAIGMLLPRLVDLTEPAGYAFATYTPSANELDLRTLTVAGPEKLRAGAGAIDAVRLSDQGAADEEAAVVWVDAKGNLLRLEAPGGLVMEPASPERVAKEFPQAGRIVPVSAPAR